jgi:hypothetical protein
MAVNAASLVMDGINTWRYIFNNQRGGEHISDTCSLCIACMLCRGCDLCCVALSACLPLSAVRFPTPRPAATTAGAEKRD